MKQGFWVTSIGLMALAATTAARAADAQPEPSAGGEVVVTAARLNAARVSIQPQLGASTYTIDSKAIDAMPGGDNTALNQVVLQAPGVAQDSFGQLHVRGEHNGLQFRLNGVILPEGLSVFSQALSPRPAGKVELITGALPAEYGLRTAGIVDITTKDGVKNGGSISIYGGSHGEIEPSAEVSGTAGNVSYFVSAGYTRDNLGIESPDGRANPLHDRTEQFQGFAYLEDTINESTRISAILGTSNQRFQIPDVSGGLNGGLTFGPNPDPSLNPPLTVNGQTDYPSQRLNDNQREATQYGVVSLLHTSDKLTTQISLFARYSSLDFSPDGLGDLLYNGIAQRASKSDTAGGVQAEGVYHLTDAHTVRGGIIAQIDRSTSQTSSQVIPLDPVSGLQTSQLPMTIIDNGARTSETFSAYLQDEWKIAAPLTLNYGVRYDQIQAFRNENQLSPRINAVWTATDTTTVHAGYARYFSPPPFELVGGGTVAKFANTTAAAVTTLDTTPYAERAHYFDVGVSQRLFHGLTLGVDSYYKLSKNLVDEGQFGAPIIETPFNYADGRQYGIEFSAAYARGPLTAYANLALEKSQGRSIDSSQFNFGPDELSYIKTHYIYLDHDQTVSASLGASYLWRGIRFGGDMIYGSGLRATGPDGVPNGDHLPGYAQVNLALSHRFESASGGALELRLDVINAFDENYKIRDGTGVGVGAPQYGPRRGVFVGLTKSFG
jgi:outer membrane receptor for ferrienterochelin and colicins